MSTKFGPLKLKKGALPAKAATLLFSKAACAQNSEIPSDYQRLKQMEIRDGNSYSTGIEDQNREPWGVNFCLEIPTQDDHGTFDLSP